MGRGAFLRSAEFRVFGREHGGRPAFEGTGAGSKVKRRIRKLAATKGPLALHFERGLTRACRRNAARQRRRLRRSMVANSGGKCGNSKKGEGYDALTDRAGYR